MELTFKQMIQHPIITNGSGDIDELTAIIGESGVGRLSGLSCISIDGETWELTSQGNEWVKTFDDKEAKSKERRDKINKALRMYDGI